MAELKKLTEEYQNYQKTLQKQILIRQKLETQLNENKIVKEEFNQIDSKKDLDVNQFLIFKSVAHVLIKQDFFESKSIVNRRIDFLQNDLSKVEKKINSTQLSIEETRAKIIQLQQQQQQDVPSKQLKETHLVNSTA